MKCFFTLLIFVSISFSLIAQSNYQPGFIVSLKGDTIKGFIDYKEWNINPRAFHFKTDLKANKVMDFNTSNSYAVTITGLEYYKRFILRVSQDQVDLSKLAVKPDTSTVTDTVFLKVLASGKNLTLYAFTDDIKKRFFVSEPGSPVPVELIFHAYYNPDESSTVKYVNAFKGQLLNIAEKNGLSTDKLSSKIANTNYTEPEIIKIAQLINGPGAPQAEQQSLSGSQWFLGAGINFSSLKYTQTSGTSYSGSFVTNVSSLFPQIETGINFYPNKNTQTLVLAIELNGSMNSFNITNSNNPGIVQSTTYLNFKQINAAIIPQITYNFYNSNALKLFLCVGAALNFSFYNQYQFITKYANSQPNYIQNNYPEFQNFWLYFPVKAGIVINKRAEIYLKYIPSSSITTDNVSISANISAYQVGFNYLLGSK